MSARTTALSALIACRRQGGWSDRILKEYIRRDGLDRRDAALASRLCYGVMQNGLYLDWCVDSFLRLDRKKLQPVVADILRLGAYQLLFMDKIPPSAAVNEAVEQGKRYANRQAAGLINGVLRAMVRTPEKLPVPERLSVRYSHSEELVALLRESVGEGLLEPLLKSHNGAPETALQVNLLKADDGAVSAALEASGANSRPHPWLPHCFLVSGFGDLEEQPFFRDGSVYVQDPAARLSVLAADPKPGMRVLDCCSAPGGKSFAAAIAMEDRGELRSCDIHSHKLRLVEAGAARLGISIVKTEERDARTPAPEWKERFDLVICDAPCSGLGVIRKKPDIRQKDLTAAARLPALQGEILNAISACVKPGGVLLYSTCTILKRENEQVAEEFLRRHTEFSPEEYALPGGLESQRGMLTLLPCLHGTDGFFICKMRKRL